MATSGECSRGEGLARLLGPLVRDVAARVLRSAVRSCTTALADQLPLPRLYSAAVYGLCHVSNAIQGGPIKTLPGVIFAIISVNVGRFS